MKKVVVLSKDKSFERSVVNALPRDMYMVTVAEIEPNSLYSYVLQFHPEILVVHYSYVKGFYQMFDMILQSKRCIIVYGTALFEEGALYNVLSNPRFFMLDDRRASSLPEVFQIMERDVLLVEAFSLQVSKLKEKAEEERLVKKAKLFLMEKRGITEEEAYKLIQRIAMDERVSKAKVAKDIINGVMR